MTQPHSEPLALLYVRVSTHRQAEEGVSLEAQERQLRAAAEAAGYRVELIREEGRSGKNIRNRPALRQALTRLNAGEAQALYVARLDRLARSVSDLLSVVAPAERRSWRLALLDLGLDTSSPHGRLVLSMLGSVAEFERGLIAERQRDVHAERRARGEVWGVTQGHRPLINQDLRSRIKAEHESGKSLRAIAADLNAQNVPTAKGGAWYASTIRHLLNSPSSKLAA